MAASENLRFDISAHDSASDAFSRFGRSVSDVSAKMDGATARSIFLDDALKRQAETAKRSTDATLKLAASDKILDEVERRLRDGALEAEFALKKEADALKAVKREADHLDGKKVRVKVEVERSGWSRIGGLFGGGGAGGSGGGGGLAGMLPAAFAQPGPVTASWGFGWGNTAAVAASDDLVHGVNLTGMISTGVTSGTFGLNWACTTASAGSINVMAGSVLTAHRIG